MSSTKLSKRPVYGQALSNKKAWQKIDDTVPYKIQKWVFEDGIDLEKSFFHKMDKQNIKFNGVVYENWEELKTAPWANYKGAEDAKA